MQDPAVLELIKRSVRERLLADPLLVRELLLDYYEGSQDERIERAWRSKVDDDGGC